MLVITFRTFLLFFSTVQITSAVPLIPEKGLKVLKP
jgi:hypothetical protein